MKFLTNKLALSILMVALCGPTMAQQKKSASAVGTAAPVPMEPKKLSAIEIFSKGFEAFQKNDFANAVELFRAGLELEPKDSNAWTYMSRAQKSSGDAAGAEQSKNNAIALGAPASAFEVEKPAKLSMPAWTRPTSFAGINLSAEVRRKLEEDPAYRLPAAVAATESPEKKNFILIETKDAELSTSSLFGLGGIIQILGYSKGTMFGPSTMFRALTDIDIQGQIYKSKVGERFGVRYRSELVTHLEDRSTYIYSYQDEVLICNAERTFTKINGKSTAETIGTIYSCSSTLSSSQKVRTLQAARSSPLGNGVVSNYYVAYFDRTGSTLSYYPEKLNELNVYE